MPDLELAASAEADVRRSRPLTVFEAQGRATPRPLLRGQTVRKLAADVLPSYLIERRWYAAKDSGVPRVGIANSISLVAEDDAVILILDVTPERQLSAKNICCLSASCGMRSAPASAILAEVRYGIVARGGVWSMPSPTIDSSGRLLARIGADDGTGQGEIPGLIFRRSALFDGLERELAATSDIERRAGEQSNTSIRIGGTMLKGSRGLSPRVHPELEIGRFLTEVAGFRNAPALLGSVELVGRGGECRPRAACCRR